MDEDFRAYYSDMFERTREWPGILPAASRPAYFGEADDIHDAVSRVRDRIVAESGVKLREDAQLFLFLNGWQMLLRPILQVREGSPKAVVDAIEADMWTVVREAADEVSNREGQELEVTGHRVINALGRSWDRLRTTEWQVWE